MRARAEHLFARTITRPAVPFRSPAPARRNPDTPVPARWAYRPPRHYPSHSRTPYAPGASRFLATSRRHHGSWPPAAGITVPGHQPQAGITVPGQRRATATATPSNQRRQHATSQSPGALVGPSRDRTRHTQHPTPHAGRASLEETTNAGPPTAPALHANHAYPLTYPRAPGSAPPATGATRPAPT